MTATIGEALAWIEGHGLNRWSYDHDAGAATRYGPRVPGELFPSNSSATLCDCSGIEIRGLVESGWPRYKDGFPESSGSMAVWAERKGPPTLLWSVHGGGKYSTLHEALTQGPDGMVATIGDHSNGDAGHTILVRKGGFFTLESSSGLGGCRVGTTSRFAGRHAITCVFLAPIDYDHAAPGLPPIPPPPTFIAIALEDDDDMNHPARILYPKDTQNLHTFVVGPDGMLRQTYIEPNGALHKQNLSRDLHLGKLAQSRPDVAIAGDGDLLVGVFAAGESGAYNELRYDATSGTWSQLVVTF